VRDRFRFNSFVHPLVKKEFLEENKSSPEKCSLIEEVTKPAWKKLVKTTQKRFIKTHLPFALLPPNLLEVGCKVIYVARNPKDVIVSFYHLNRLFRTQGYLRDFAKYWYYFKNDQRKRLHFYPPEIHFHVIVEPWTPYWSHIQEGWERRHEPNLLFMFYEDMTKDLKKCITRVSQFLEVKYTEEQHEELQEHLKIDNFRNNKSVNAELLRDLGIIRSGEGGFVRKGKSGGWREYFVGELNEEADQWIEENLKKTDLRFPES
jgi:hypothetical protein